MRCGRSKDHLGGANSRDGPGYLCSVRGLRSQGLSPDNILGRSAVRAWLYRRTVEGTRFRRCIGEDKGNDYR